jgi:murein DD-endopeptidase MepM/ murein hydrolase activator NlpD
MTYTVKSGDSLSKIASKYGISWRDLYNQNKSVVDSTAMGRSKYWLYPNQKLTIPGQSAPTPKKTVAPKTPTVTPGTSAGEKAKLTPWGEVLPWEQYFNPELVKGSAMETAAAYYAPQAQRGMESLESNFADRGLTRSGMRGKNIASFYDELGRQQRGDVEADIIGAESDARQEYQMLQQQYEQSEGKEKPATTAYEAYNLEPPTTSAGRYGTTYLNWLNNILK